MHSNIKNIPVMKLVRLVLTFICASSPAWSQWEGGTGDGAGVGQEIASTCIPLATADLFSGNIGDGHTTADRIGTLGLCNPLATADLFRGGNNDGHNFSDRILTPIDCSTILPVELIYFVSQCEDDMVILNWATASELNNDYFTISYSTDGVQWEKLATIQGAGNASQANHYQHQFRRFWKEDVIYFQLSQTDFNGTTAIEGIRSIQCEVNNIQLFPNPNSGVFFIEGLPEKSTIQIFNILGAKVYETEENNAFTTLELNHLAPGVYSVRIYRERANIIHQDKVVINK